MNIEMKNFGMEHIGDIHQPQNPPRASKIETGIRVRIHAMLLDCFDVDLLFATGVVKRF